MSIYTFKGPYGHGMTISGVARDLNKKESVKEKEVIKPLEDCIYGDNYFADCCIHCIELDRCLSRERQEDEENF